MDQTNENTFPHNYEGKEGLFRPVRREFVQMLCPSNGASAKRPEISPISCFLANQSPLSPFFPVASPHVQVSAPTLQQYTTDADVQQKSFAWWRSDRCVCYWPTHHSVFQAIKLGTRCAKITMSRKTVVTGWSGEGKCYFQRTTRDLPYSKWVPTTFRGTPCWARRRLSCLLHSPYSVYNNHHQTVSYGCSV